MLIFHSSLVYTILAAQLIVVAIYRYNLASTCAMILQIVTMAFLGHLFYPFFSLVIVNNNDRSADVKMAPVNSDGSAISASVPSNTDHYSTAAEDNQAPIFRPTFQTAGNVVALATLGTFALEIALVVLVLGM